MLVPAARAAGFATMLRVLGRPGMALVAMFVATVFVASPEPGVACAVVETVGVGS